MNTEIKFFEHFYTTDFYQASAFDKTVQVMNIYYLVQPENPETIKISTRKNDFSFSSNKEESFRLVKLSELTTEMLSYPIDKKVVSLLRSETT